jgi:hypothetical protein
MKLFQTEFPQACPRSDLDGTIFFLLFALSHGYSVHSIADVHRRFFNPRKRNLGTGDKL